MASDKLLVNSFQSSAANTPQIAFIANPAAQGTLINAVTVANNTSSDITYSAYIAVTSPDPTLPQIPERVLFSKKTDIPPEITGHVVNPGEALWFQSSVISSASLTVTGRELT